MGMSEELLEEQPALTKKEKTKADKQAEHIARIKRTLVASLLGILTGILSYWSGGTPNIAGLQENGFLAFMLMLAGVVVQKHIFRLLGMDTSKLGAKDWFYQGFMTFAFWFMTWTILLTSVSPVQL
jgi:EMC6-arch